MALEINLKNEFVSANNMQEENTLVFYDSDGEFIGDIYLDETVYPTDVGALLAELFSIPNQIQKNLRSPCRAVLQH